LSSPQTLSENAGETLSPAMAGIPHDAKILLSNAKRTPLHANRLVDKLVHMAHQTTVGVFDAKTHLNGLLKRVSKGETIRITRRGVPIAKLVPADAGEREEPDHVVREIRELRKGANLGKTTIRELINAGRHY
jgi:prevent-host-death family protein